VEALVKLKDFAGTATVRILLNKCTVIIKIDMLFTNLQFDMAKERTINL